MKYSLKYLKICYGCDMPTGDAYSSGHLVPSLWDLHMFYLLRPILFPELVVILPDYALRISFGTSNFIDSALNGAPWMLRG